MWILTADMRKYVKAFIYSLNIKQSPLSNVTLTGWQASSWNKSCFKNSCKLPHLNLNCLFIQDIRCLTTGITYYDSANNIKYSAITWYLHHLHHYELICILCYVCHIKLPQFDQLRRFDMHRYSASVISHAHARHQSRRWQMIISGRSNICVTCYIMSNSYFWA